MRSSVFEWVDEYREGKGSELFSIQGRLYFDVKQIYLFRATYDCGHLRGKWTTSFKVLEKSM